MEQPNAAARALLAHFGWGPQTECLRGPVKRGESSVVLERFSLANFKSFAAADLPLGELTVLIGPNASGKSNLIEALQLLSWLARGRRLHDLQMSLRDREVTLRGLERELFASGEVPLQFFAEVRGPAELGTLRLSLGIFPRDGQLSVSTEQLEASALKSPVLLYAATPIADPGGTLTVSYNNFSRGTKPEISVIDQQAVFTQLTTPARFDARHERSQALIPAATACVQRALESIRFLDPTPSLMRSYAFKTEVELVSTGQNVSAVIYELCKTPEGKQGVVDFIRALPEQHIDDVTFVETSRSEVMLQLVETFGGRASPRDAAVLSDGTLRVLAIAAALLSAKAGELIVIEEIDNGVHPSRAQYLVDQIQRTAQRRNIRVLLTTHNPALMNALNPRALAAVVVCYRDEGGNSRLVRLEDIQRYPELLAQGRLGDLASDGVLDKFIKTADPYDAGSFFSLLQASEGQ